MRDREAEREAARRARHAAKREAATERAARKAESARRRQADEQARDDAAARAFAHYERVRDWAARWRDDAASTASARDRAVAAGLAHLWNATPETIASLRRWCEPMSGVRAADYEPASAELEQRMQQQIMSLRNHRVETELVVGEPAILGGFGVTRYGLRFDEESVQWAKCLGALEDGAVLGQFRGTRRRHVVWDIAGGWGGFAYRFKTVCPHVTYLVTGRPETLLVSAVYLMTAFPQAVCRFLGDPATPDPWASWETTDFVFAPDQALDEVRPPRLDLTLDVMALRHMDSDAVWTRVVKAFDHGSSYFYSAFPGATAPVDAPRVCDVVGRRYWVQPVPPRDKAGLEFPPPAALAEPVHVVGWKRLRV